ncbi:hypothetical protein AGLY_014353 [Aphis glycines]|uniref:BED-type domain-containing protein n=1 Tax=Aphis glycines TaxID=307491 RepID=A0A6G0T4L9_APHGL|nr:hypothetical protein AGLY_014353 [Aphis glycines]
MSKSSVIWDYFQLDSDNINVKCGLCRTKLKNNRSSTSNLIRHIKSKHPTVNLLNRNTRVLEETVDDPNDALSTSTTNTIISTTNLVVNQTETSLQIPSNEHVIRPQSSRFVNNPITQYLSKPLGASRRKIIDQQVLKMIVKEYYPFSIVEDREFVKLLNLLNPGYTLPSRKTLSKSLLPIMYNEIHDKVKQDIKDQAKYVSITTDSWTSIKNENYIAVTCHFINNECELKSYLLSCFKNSESHSSENLKNDLLAVIKKWGLEHNIAACTTDNAHNIVKAVGLCGWRHVGCFAHSLNLAVQTALKSISDTRDKVSGIVGHFERSPQAAEKLRAMQEQLGLTPPLMLIHDVVTRWNSTYEMFQRIQNLKVPLSFSCEVLKYFKEITVEISSEKSVSISKSVVFSRALLKHCTYLDTQFYDSQQLTNMISTLKQQVEQRFGPIEKIQIYAEATVLDPRFKKYGFLNNSSFTESKKTIINKATDIHIGMKNTMQPAIQNQSVTIGGDSIWNDFDEEVCSQLISTNPTYAAIVEIDKYLQEGLIPRHENLLKWWKDNRNVYPCLFELMKKRLCVLATSVPCERIFSKAGQTISKKRK